MSRLASLFLVTLTTLLVGCSSIPQELKVDETVELNYYPRLEQGQAVQGEWFRVAGVIASIENQTDQTRIELANVPLKGKAKPNLGQEPQGRVVLYVPQFLEPVKYAPGRLITVNGTFTGEEQSQVGEHTLTLPVLAVESYYLWTIRERVVLNDYPSRYPCRSLYCHPFDSGPTSGRIIQEVK